jgi:rifampicin phosphotransferase
MATVEGATELRFEAPGPGYFELDPVHFPRPLTRYWQETHPEAFARGTADFARFYGMLIGGLNGVYINGFNYKSVAPPPEDEIPQRFERAAEVFAGKLWREQLKEWDTVSKPTAIAKHRELQSVDPDALSDEELAAYVERCRDHHAAMITQHMRFTASAVVPTGDFLAHVGDWTGLPPSELLDLMRGASPVSAGASVEMQRLVMAIGADPAAQELLASGGAAADVLEQLQALPGETGPAVTAYLDLIGNRLLDGFDISEPAAREMPSALLRAIQTAVASGDAEESDVESRIATVREQVPEEHREEFDELLGEARLTYRLRDERGVYSDIWASGIMRRAMLAAGDRLASRGQIHEPVHAIDAGVGEIRALLTGTDGPSADELQERFAYRTSHTAKDAPATLGTPSPPPDMAGLPPAVARLMRATGIALGAVFGSSEAEHEEQVLHGLAASKGVYEGPARLVTGPAEFDRIVKGDILVTQSTTEAFNILLPLLGAIVTDSGGLLSHSAIVAREYGIPGVVGTREATQRIADGARLRVDGDAGEVSLLA